MSVEIRDRGEMAREIGERVREARKALEWSQEKLARETSLSRETIRRIEDGVTLPAVNTVEGLARALGVGPNDLLDWPTGLYLNALAGTAA